MHKRKPNKKARRNASKKAQQSVSKPVPQQSPCASKTNDANAPSADVNKTNVASTGRFNVTRLGAILTLLCLIASSIGTYLVGEWLRKPAQEQANEAKQANDRNAGRLGPRAEIVALIPDRESEEMKNLEKPIHPEMKMWDIGGKEIPATFPTFDDVHTFCRVNPRVRVKNTGNEIIEGVRIQVEEMSVMPVSPNGLYSLRDSRNTEKHGPVSFKPTLDPTHTEDCAFAEKFKPGDEALVPIWRPLIKAMLGAHVLINGRFQSAAEKRKPVQKTLEFPDWTGQYHAGFIVRLYVRAIGADAFDTTEKGPITLGFIWSAKGFNDEDCNRILERPMALRVIAARE